MERYTITIRDAAGTVLTYETRYPPAFQVGDRIRHGTFSGVIEEVEHEIIGDEYRILVRTASAPMSRGVGGGPITDFLRYHVLIRVFHGNIGQWLMVLRATHEEDGDDARFLRWLQDRLQSEPQLINEIRKEVDASGLWPSP